MVVTKSEAYFAMSTPLSSINKWSGESKLLAIEEVNKYGTKETKLNLKFYIFIQGHLCRGNRSPLCFNNAPNSSH